MYISKENAWRNVEHHDFYGLRLHNYYRQYLHKLYTHIQDYKADVSYSYGSHRINNIYSFDLLEHFINIHKLHRNLHYLILVIH